MLLCCCGDTFDFTAIALQLPRLCAFFFNAVGTLSWSDWRLKPKSHYNVFPLHCLCVAQLTGTTTPCDRQKKTRCSFSDLGVVTELPLSSFALLQSSCLPLYGAVTASLPPYCAHTTLYCVHCAFTAITLRLYIGEYTALMLR